MMTPDTASNQCRHCTVPVDRGEVCSFCQQYQPPAGVLVGCLPDQCDCPCDACRLDCEHHDDGMVVPNLLAEADRAINEVRDAIAARMAHACSAFPVAGWSCYVTEVDGNRITISATRRDPQTRTCTTREFVAQLREVTL